MHILTEAQNVTIAKKKDILDIVIILSMRIAIMVIVMETMDIHMGVPKRGPRGQQTCRVGFLLVYLTFIS